MRLTPLIIALALTTGGCATVAKDVVNTVQALSSASPTQASTLADAQLAYKVAATAVDVYVTTGQPNRAVLTELLNLNEGVHNALLALEKANTNNQSILIAAFNEAYKAFTSYGVSVGVKV